jgi:hypothetical protein
MHALEMHLLFADGSALEVAGPSRRGDSDFGDSVFGNRLRGGLSIVETQV